MKKAFVFDIKKAIILLACITVLFLNIRGLVNHIPNPDTNLEFWIADPVDRMDFATHQEKYGLMGGREYYGKGYIPTKDENGEQRDPEHCVIYTVTAYPDYSSNKRCVTRIYITDPTIELYGVTLESSLGEIDTAMRKHGFRESDAPGVTYQKGKVTIRFNDEAIWVMIRVSNLFRLQF